MKESIKNLIEKEIPFFGICMLLSGALLIISIDNLICYMAIETPFWKLAGSVMFLLISAVCSRKLQLKIEKELNKN